MLYVYLHLTDLSVNRCSGGRAELNWQQEEGVILRPAQFASHGDLILLDAGEDDPYLLIRKQDGLYSEIDLATS